MNSRDDAPVGMTMLGTYSMSKILQCNCLNKISMTVADIKLDIYVDQFHGVIITNPLAQDNRFTGVPPKPTLLQLEAHLKTIPEYKKIRLIAPVVGEGFFVDHIVTVFKNTVDSDARFIINSKGQHTFKIDAHDDVIELGTQSILDQTSCGYHTLSNISHCYQFSKDDLAKRFTHKQIEKSIRQQSAIWNPVSFGLAMHKQAKDTWQPAVGDEPIKSVPDLSWLGHLSKAARETYSPDPQKSKRWWWNPFNLPELLLRGIKETFAWAADKIHVHTNRTSAPRQWLWTGVSGLLHLIQYAVHGVAAGFGKIAQGINSICEPNKKSSAVIDDEPEHLSSVAEADVPQSGNDRIGKQGMKLVAIFPPAAPVADVKEEPPISPVLVMQPQVVAAKPPSAMPAPGM